jgi:hypothetical protein
MSFDSARLEDTRRRSSVRRERLEVRRVGLLSHSGAQSSGETRVVAAESCVVAILVPTPGFVALYHLQTSRLDGEADGSRPADAEDGLLSILCVCSARASGGPQV